MNKYFDIKDKVYDVTQKYPETIDVFVGHGFDQLKNDKMRKLMGKTISVEMALRSKKINVDLFTEKLIQAIEGNRELVDGALNIKEEIKGDINIEGVLPCPVRIPLLEGINKWIDNHTSQVDYIINYKLESADRGVDWIRESIKAKDKNGLSDLYMSAGFDLFFDKDLLGQYYRDGVFENITGLDKLNKDFDNDYIDLKDPRNIYSVIAAVPAVFMVNTEELNGRDMPKSWSDLLTEDFEDSISLPLRDYDLMSAIFLNIYKDYGIEGINKLEKALLQSMHPAEMVKSSSRRGKSNLPTVTVMPYFFTRMVKEDSPLKPVWPEEGAIISPVFLLAKKDSKDKSKPFVDFLFSKEIGELLSSNGYFPSTQPDVDNNLDENQKFKWLGWEYIYNNNLEEILNKCTEIFGMKK